MNLELDKICVGLIVISMLLSGCTAEGPVDPKQGCTDKLASNFDINAELDNGECEYADLMAMDYSTSMKSQAVQILQLTIMMKPLPTMMDLV